MKRFEVVLFFSYYFVSTGFRNRPEVVGSPIKRFFLREQVIHPLNLILSTNLFLYLPILNCENTFLISML